MQGRSPQLDGIRGVAILVVILHNETAKYPFLNLERVFANGWMGVDLFFVLSGFLITGILLDTKDGDGYFKNFYIRRCLRIWPLYYAALFLMFVVVPQLRPVEGEEIFRRSSPWWSFPFFIQNFLVAVPDRAAGLLGVTWSLAIEEQFYLVWPFVIRFCSSRSLIKIGLSVVLFSPLLRLLFMSWDIGLYANTFARLDGLMIGSLLAVGIRSPGFVAPRFLPIAWGLLVIAWPLAFLTIARRADWIVYSFSALGSASLVYLALYSPNKWLQASLRNRFIIYTGTISYGLYLLHKVPFNLGQVLGLDAYPALAAPVLLGASYGIAALSWNLLEKPFLRLKRFFETERMPRVLVGLRAVDHKN